MHCAVPRAKNMSTEDQLWKCFVGLYLSKYNAKEGLANQAAGNWLWVHCPKMCMIVQTLITDLKKGILDLSIEPLSAYYSIIKIIFEINLYLLTLDAK